MLPEDMSRRFVGEKDKAEPEMPKDRLRAEIAQQTADYLARGGKIDVLPILTDRETIERVRNMTRKQFQEWQMQNGLQ